ncbi:hypothetical protein MR857_03420 [bacterium]|nr:hypothetical protein [bacterium]MDY3022031.1 hypothetical protein [Oliverpabstia sp.]
MIIRQPHIIHYAYSEGAIAHLVEQELEIVCVAETVRQKFRLFQGAEFLRTVSFFYNYLF